MKINSRHYILILFALASIVITIYGYIFLYQKTIVQAEHYIGANNRLEDEDNQKRNEQDLVKLYNSTKDSRAKLISYLVKEDNVVSFIEMIENIGDQTNTKIEISSITNEDSLVKAKINAKGSWSGIMSTLKLIENLTISSKISEVRMNSTSNLESKKHEWELNLDIQALTIK